MIYHVTFAVTLDVSMYVHLEMLYIEHVLGFKSFVFPFDVPCENRPSPTSCEVY